MTNGKRAGNACSDCYLEPTSSELDLYSRSSHASNSLLRASAIAAPWESAAALGSWFVGLTRVPTVSSYGEPTTSRPWSETVGSAETSKKPVSPVWKGSGKFPGWKQ